MIAIIDYGIGNLYSISSAFEAIKCDACITNKEDEIRDADRIVLPGVGAFSEGMEHLRNVGLIPLLSEVVVEKGKPILGICLGMQLFFEKSYEDGEHNGLGWIEGVVRKIVPRGDSMKIPHMGWNDVRFKKGDPLSFGMTDRPNFYFVHSYYVDCNGGMVTSRFDYGGLFTASIRRGNIFGVQFHPEKSQSYGLKLLENFVAYGGE